MDRSGVVFTARGSCCGHPDSLIHVVGREAGPSRSSVPSLLVSARVRIGLSALRPNSGASELLRPLAGRASSAAVDPGERLLAPEQRDALEDPGRDGRRRRSRRAPAGTPRPACTPRLSTTPRSAASTRLPRRTARRAASASRAARERSAPPSRPITFSNAAGSSAGPSNRNAGQRPEVGRASGSSRARSRPRRAGRRARVLLQPAGQLVDAELAQVAAVDVAQLALVEHGRVLRDALEPEALGQLGAG